MSNCPETLEKKKREIFVGKKVLRVQIEVEEEKIRGNDDMEEKGEHVSQQRPAEDAVGFVYQTAECPV